MYCIKCQAHLCCQGNRNCYTPFHTEDKGKIIHLNYSDSDQSDQETDADEPDSENVLSEPESLLSESF